MKGTISDKYVTVVFTDGDWEIFRFLSDHVYVNHIGCGIEHDFPFVNDHGVCRCKIPDSIQGLMILNNHRYTCEVEETWDGWYTYNGEKYYDYHTHNGRRFVASQDLHYHEDKP